MLLLLTLSPDFLIPGHVICPVISTLLIYSSLSVNFPVYLLVHYLFSTPSSPYLDHITSSTSLLALITHANTSLSFHFCIYLFFFLFTFIFYTKCHANTWWLFIFRFRNPSVSSFSFAPLMEKLLSLCMSRAVCTFLLSTLQSLLSKREVGVCPTVLRNAS